jgi:hypothetical protein
MPAHLRELARCRTCGRPATQELYNAVNAPLGVYCSRHGKAALRAFETREGTR